MQSDRDLLKQALEALEINNQAWKQLADSGDAGFWEAEEQPFYGTSVKAMNALRERLAQPEQSPLDRMAENARELGLDYEPVQEPVAHRVRMERVDHAKGKHWWNEGARIRMPSPELYNLGDTILCWVNEGDYYGQANTTPPRREWQGLTDEIDELAREMVKGDKSVNWLARAIEAKLKEKNA